MDTGASRNKRHSIYARMGKAYGANETLNLNRSALIFAVGVGILVAGVVANYLVPSLGYSLGLMVGMTYAFLIAGTYDWRRGFSGVPKDLQGPQQCANCGVLSPDFVAAAKHGIQTGHQNFRSYPKREVNQ